MRRSRALSFLLTCAACSAEPTTSLDPDTPDLARAPRATNTAPPAAPEPPAPEKASTVAAPRAPVEEEPSPPPAAEAAGAEPEVVPELLALAREVFVLDRPSADGKKIGYLRAGARVRRSAEPAGFDGCSGGYYRVAPEGYVCAGPFARLDADHPLARLGRVRADRMAPLPYAYAKAGPVPPILYTRLPEQADLRWAEPEYRGRSKSTLPFGLTPENIPDELAAGRTTPAPFGRYEPSTLNAGRALPDSSFALLESFSYAGRTYALSADYLLLPADRLEPVRPSTFHGIALEPGETQVAFVMRRGAQRFAGDPARGLRVAGALDYREAVVLSGEQARVGAGLLRELSNGDWVRDEGLLLVDTPSDLPSFARGSTTWIRVSLSRQTLVAYEGERPVYATLVSTGKDGAGDPETTFSTVQGQFRIHTKHVTARMDNDEPDDEYDHRDVPWVAYFSEGYALHAAYWHDAFGTPRSHGCVNLSPADARFLFHWTEPAVPQLWHGALGPGTRVVIVE
jgi:hypothetical protein